MLIFTIILTDYYWLTFKINMMFMMMTVKRNDYLANWLSFFVQLSKDVQGL